MTLFSQLSWLWVSQMMVCDASSVRLEGSATPLCLPVAHRSAQHSDASAGREITAAFFLVNVLSRKILQHLHDRMTS